MLTRHHCIPWVLWVLQRFVLWNLLLVMFAFMALHALRSVKSCMSSRGNGNQCQEDDSKDMSKRNERLLTPLDIHQTIWQCNCFSVSKLRMGSVNQYPLSAREMLGQVIEWERDLQYGKLAFASEIGLGMAYFDVCSMTLMYFVFSSVGGRLLTVWWPALGLLWSLFQESSVLVRTFCVVFAHLIRTWGEVFSNFLTFQDVESKLGWLVMNTIWVHFLTIWRKLAGTISPFH